MSRIDPPDDDDLDAATETLLDQISGIHGFVPNQHRLEAYFPLLLRSLLDLNRRVLLAGGLDPELLEVIALVLAVENECDYCRQYHAGLLAEREITADGVDQLLEDWTDYDFAPRSRTIVEFAVTVNHDPHDIDDSDIEELIEYGLDEKDLVQLVHFVNLMGGYQTFNVVFDTDPDTERGNWMQ